MPIELPTQVLQGLGLALPPLAQPPPLPPVDSSLAGAPGLVDVPPLPPVPAPSVVAPPQSPVPDGPVLPSLAHSSEPPPPAPSKDFQVPVGAFGHGQATPQPSQPRAPSPMPPDAQLQRAQQKQSQADVDAVDAVAATRDANIAKSRDDLAANEAFQKQDAAIQKQRNEFAEQSAKVHAQKQAYVDSTMKAVDNYKVDQQKYWNDMGVGKHIGWYIAMAMSGLGEAMQGRGGANPVIQMLQQKMHDSVVAQIDQRDQLKEKNQRAQHDLDKYDAWSTNKMAQINLLDAQNDRRLSNELKMAAAKAAEPQQKALALTEAAKLEQSSADKAQKAAEFASTDYNAKQQLRVAQGNLNVARANALETNRHNLATEALTEQARLLESQKAEKQGKTDEAKLIRERAVGGEVKPVVDANGKVVDRTVGLITKKDGTTWIPNGTEPVVSEFQKGHDAALRLLSTIDEMRRLGPEWLSSTANSTKFQQLKQQMADARLEAIKYHGLGVPTGHDVELAEGSIGTPDPTRWKDSMAGLDKSREAIIRNMNITMHARGLDKDWEGPFDPLKAPEAKKTPTQELQTSLKEKPDENKERVWQATYAQTLKSSGDIETAKRAANEAMTTAGAISPSQRDDLDRLKSQAIAGDADALAAIQDVAKSGGSPTIKRMAVEALSEIRTAAAPPGSPAPDPLGYSNVYDPAGYDPASLINRFHAPVEPTINPRIRNASNP